MLIAGDIASPNAVCSEELKRQIEAFPSIFGDKNMVCNLEGMLYLRLETRPNKPVLYNHPTVLAALAAANVRVVTLANNHTLDLPQSFDDSVRQLNEAGIATVGAGRSPEMASKPASFCDGDTEVIVFNECWEFLLYSQKNPVNGIHVAEIQFDALADRVGQVKQEKTNSCIVVYLHWSIDFEVLPFPMYRLFARSLIDAGASVVVGCHSHCVQGGEQYREGTIVYGLGNFFLPNGYFAGGRLSAPPLAELQVVLDYDPASKRSTCHWFRFKSGNGGHIFEHLESEAFETSALLKAHSPYASLDQAAYVRYFREKRRKRVLIPVFRTYSNSARLWFETKLLKYRARIARTMAKLNLIRWGS